MNVLLLTPRPHLLIKPIIHAGDDYEISMDEPNLWPKNIDFIVSFGYRHIIPEPYISEYKGRMINIHISMLPWNRGADPNFWSWFDDTPKGVSIHLISNKIDTGDIIAQEKIIFHNKYETLRSSYEFLNKCAVMQFAITWQRFGRGYFKPQTSHGTYHRSSDKDQWMKQLPLGYDTPVSEVQRLGEKARETVNG